MSRKELYSIDTHYLSKGQWDDKMDDLMNNPDYRLINISSATINNRVIHYSWFEHTNKLGGL